MDEETITIIRKQALINAIKHSGKANSKAIIGAVIAEKPEVKKEMKETIKTINEITEEINNLSIEEQKKELLKIEPEFFEEERNKREQRRKERKELPELPGAEEGKVTTRIPPEPSKHAHIGHALSFLINYLYAKKYKGRCVLRFDDTNPEKEEQEYVDSIIEDLKEYLQIKPDEIIYASDRMNKYYELAEELINKNMAYVCFCPQEKIREQRKEMKECEHREGQNNKELWEKMKKGEYEEGSCVLRLKIDMKHKNAVMRDPAIFRISNKKHYRQGEKYHAWPLYDFESALEDAFCGVTHVLRSNEFQERIELQEHIRKLFGLKSIITKQYGRFNITGATTQGREIRRMIETGEYLGWDDPRLVTLKALRRRGIVKETIYELATIIGMSKKQTNIDYSVIAAINRRILDEEAKRLMAIEEPVKITIKGLPEEYKEEKIRYHPDKEELGSRTISFNQEFYIERKDYEKLREGQTIRLMDLMTIRIGKNKEAEYLSKEYEEYAKSQNKGGIIHYVPEKEATTIKVLMPDAKEKELIAEKAIKEIKKGEVIQLIRWGFCRLDEEGKTPKLWYAHE